MTSMQGSRNWCCGLVTLLLAACAAPPPEKPLSCPVCADCSVCAPIATTTIDTAPPLEIPPPDAAPKPEPRGKLVRTSWLNLPNWGREDVTPALAAFVQSCAVLASRPEWREVCAEAARVQAQGTPAATFFTDRFEPFQVVNRDDSDSGTITGYYEPLLHGSRVRTGKYKYPLYAAPQDLITVDLGDVYPDLKNRRLRGRLVGNKLVPYWDRGDIERSHELLRGLEIVWIDNPVEVFFLHIQGSGQVLLPGGSRIRIGYADQNGHPFRSVAGMLIRRGELRAEQTTLDGMKTWARKHPAKVSAYLDANPSYVFFKELPNELSGPIGTLGVPLAAERSLAVDARVIPLGVPVYLATTYPGSPRDLQRLMVAQDTGGAIFGGVRADFYWGFGDAAGAEAGRMKQAGRMWVLLPRGYDPNPPPAAQGVADKGKP
ncbi:MAG: murein transglycosylase A [Betaproteobacteria bacterium]|nr:murein transglycosylase A [Betaproteobacteria bacterium]